jgi:hypothetical protein
MSIKYTREQRGSIYKPATINDFPPEVLRNCLVYLDLPNCNWHLASASLVNRAFHPVAMDVLRQSARFEESLEVQVCCTFVYNLLSDTSAVFNSRRSSLILRSRLSSAWI